MCSPIYSRNAMTALVPHASIAQLHLLPHGSHGRPLSGTELRHSMKAMAASADVLVIDTVAGLGSALALQHDAHVVAVAVDARRSKVKQLEELGLVLADVRDRLLPVLTQPTAHARPKSPKRLSGRGDDGLNEEALPAVSDAPAEVPGLPARTRPTARRV